MANLLRLIVDLAEDPSARAAFRDDPDHAVAGIDDLTREDVETALEVAAVQVDPDIAPQLTVLGLPHDPDTSPRDAAVEALLSLCETVELAGIITFPRSAGQMPRYDEHVVPSGPPGRTRPAHLRALDGEGGTEPDEPGNARNLAPVPDPPGGFEFGVLELVSLPEGIPDAGVEPGARGTVVAVHRDPALSYEIEVSGDDGGRQFLGILPPSALARVPD